MNRKLILALLAANLVWKPLDSHATVSGLWGNRFLTEYSDALPGLGGFRIPEFALLSNFVCVGRIMSFQNDGNPKIEIIQTLYGPTNILEMTPDYFEVFTGIPVSSTNIFFVLTNDWWNINMTATNSEVIQKNRQMTHAWEVVTNHPLDNAVFTNWFLLEGSEGVIRLDTNDTEEVVHYVSNLVHIAKIAKDKRQFFDFVGGYETNAPVRLKKEIKTYYGHRFFDPSKPRDLFKTLRPYIDYDMLWEGLEEPNE